LCDTPPQLQVAQHTIERAKSDRSLIEPSRPVAPYVARRVAGASLERMAAGAADLDGVAVAVTAGASVVAVHGDAISRPQL